MNELSVKFITSRKSHFMVFRIYLFVNYTEDRMVIENVENRTYVSLHFPLGKKN